jgi:hypothetical protein
VIVSDQRIRLVHVQLRPDDVHQALAKWERFPVDHEPRPIVLTGSGVVQLERLRADAQWRAVFDGPAVPESDLPPELLAAAIDYCRDVQTLAPRPLARIIRANGPFGTDRGIRQLPAWMMYPDDRRWPFIALDPQFNRRMTWWPDGLSTCGHEPSMLAGDGRTLTYRFMGTPAVYAAYPHANVFETATAVLVEPVAVNLAAPDNARLDYAEEREVVVHLAAPLGNRVLIWSAHGRGTGTFGAPRTVITSSEAN